MCKIYDCKHNKRGACSIRHTPCGDTCNFYARPLDNRTALVHGPVKSGGRHTFFK